MVRDEPDTGTVTSKRDVRERSRRAVNINPRCSFKVDTLQGDVEVVLPGNTGLSGDPPNNIGQGKAGRLTVQGNNRSFAVVLSGIHPVDRARHTGEFHAPIHARTKGQIVEFNRDLLRPNALLFAVGERDVRERDGGAGRVEVCASAPVLEMAVAHDQFSGIPRLHQNEGVA